MKKTFRFTLLVLAVISAALLFTGCSDMDELRAQRMKWADSKHEKIVFEEKIYKSLPHNAYFFVETYCREEYYVAEEDVPLLLSGEILGEPVCISEDKSILECCGRYFAVESEYEYYLDIIENAKLDRFFVMIERFDEDGDFYYCEREVLDKKLCGVINEALEKKSVSELPEDDFYVSGTITRCDGTGMMNGDSLYVYCCSETGEVYYEEGRNYYRLPDEYYETFENIIKMTTESYEAYCPDEVSDE